MEFVAVFSVTQNFEKRVRTDQPLRVIRESPIRHSNRWDWRVRQAVFTDRAGAIPAEGLMRVLLSWASYSIRSERQLVEQIDYDRYDLLFRWLVRLGIEDPVWDATTFTKNRDRLLEGDIAAQFLAAVLSQDKLKACCRASTSRSTAFTAKLKQFN
jgi:hypothetical protein